MPSKPADRDGLESKAKKAPGPPIHQDHAAGARPFTPAPTAADLKQSSWRGTAKPNRKTLEDLLRRAAQLASRATSAD